MRHQTKKHTLGKAKDQRDALLRSLATELFVHEPNFLYTVKSKQLWQEQKL